MAQQDLALVVRFAQRRDEQSFAQIVGRYGSMVYATCYRILGDRARAEEVSQETFFLLFRKPQVVTRSLGGWLHRAATRLAIDAVRSDAARQCREKAYARQKLGGISRWQEVSAHIDRGLERLDEQSRQLLVQHFLEGVTQCDLAAQFKVSGPTMSRRIKRAASQLRRYLAEEGAVLSIPILVDLLRQNAIVSAPRTLIRELGKMAMVSQLQPVAQLGAGQTSFAGAVRALGHRIALMAAIGRMGAEPLTFLITVMIAAGLALAGFVISADQAPAPPTISKQPSCCVER